MAGLPERCREAFTLVFEGNMGQFKVNPFTTDTPYGRPYAVALGDVLKERDALEEKLKSLTSD